MSSMTEQEIFDSSVAVAEKWFYENSLILSDCLEQDIKLQDIYGDNHVCPYYISLIELFNINMEKGWTKSDLLNSLEKLSNDNIWKE